MARPLAEVAKACGNRILNYMGVFQCVWTQGRSVAWLHVSCLLCVGGGAESKDGLGTPEKFPGGRDAPGLLRSRHQTSGQQGSVAQQGDPRVLTLASLFLK